MNNTVKKYIFGALCVSLLASCDKSKETTAPAEGYVSTTDKTVAVEFNDNEEFVTPLFQMHFSDDVSKEEGEARFDKAFAQHKIENKDIFSNKHRGVSTEWFFKIQTYTGTQTNNETDGKVMGKLTYLTNIGTYHTNWRTLDNSGDDREGGWDIYIFRSFIADAAVSWIEIKKEEIGLLGTDGWFLKDFDAIIKPANQNVPATGYSSIFRDVNRWLDSPSSSQWDTWSSGTVNNTGRLNF